MLDHVNEVFLHLESVVSALHEHTLVVEVAFEVVEFDLRDRAFGSGGLVVLHRVSYEWHGERILLHLRGLLHDGVLPLGFSVHQVDFLLADGEVKVLGVHRVRQLDDDGQATQL